MPIFEYQAIDTAGNQVRGTIVQGSAAEATKILQHRGFVVTGVTAASTGIEPNSLEVVKVKKLLVSSGGTMARERLTTSDNPRNIE